MTVNGPGGFTDSNMGGGIPPGSTGRRPFADHSNQQAPNLGLANRDGQTSRLAAQTRQYEGMYAPPTQGGMNPLTGEVSWHEELTENSKNVPSNYNMAHGGAVKYTTDSAHKENFRDRAAIRAGIVENGGQVNFVESIQDSDVKICKRLVILWNWLTAIATLPRGRTRVVLPARSGWTSTTRSTSGACRSD